MSINPGTIVYADQSIEIDRMKQMLDAGGQM